jgi:1,4-dihydroxy-2-naphthoate octaprenyltransferase
VAKSRFSVWVLAARPKTLPAGLAPVLIGTAMAFADGRMYWPAALAAALGSLLIQIGTNYANDYFDYKKGADTHERLGPIRVTQAGLVTPHAMKAAIILVFLAALLVGAYLVYRGGLPIAAIGILSILFGVLYTGGPYPLGYNGLGDIFVLIFFGPVAVGGTYFVQSLTITTPVICAGLAPGLFSVAILTVNNLRDIDSDRTSGKKTLAVRFGRRFAVTEYVLCIVAACLVPPILIIAYDHSTWVAVASATVLLAIPAMRTVVATSGKPLNHTLALTGRLLLIFSLLFSIGWNL